MEQDLGLALVGKNGKRQEMENGIFTVILALAGFDSKEEYSDSDAKALAIALKSAVTRPPYNRRTTKSALLGTARFFKACRGFTVEKWSPHRQRGPSKGEMPRDPRTYALFKTVRHRLAEMEK